MPSELQRVAQDLVTCLDQMPAVAAALDSRARRCREAAAYLAGFGSVNPASQMAALQLEAAARACEEAGHHAMTAHRRARSWAAEMIRGGAQGSSAPTSDRPAGGEVKAHPGRGNPGAQRTIRDRLPARPDPLAKTHGIWFGSEGEDVDLISGYDHHSDQADRVREQLGLPPLTIVSHVEVKFAMFMRERGLRSETIYINNVPCKGLRSCSRYLESFLPKGSRLTVHWPDSEPRTFEGKGPE